MATKARLTAETARMDHDDAVFEIECRKRGRMQIHLDLRSPCVQVVDDDPEPPPPAVDPVPEGAPKVALAMAQDRIPDASWSYDDVAQFIIANDIPTPHGANARQVSKVRLLTAIAEWDAKRKAPAPTPEEDGA